MLDTIVLTLSNDKFRILEPERFSPSAQGLLCPPYYRLGARGSFSCYQNPTPKEFLEGNYKPRLTLTKRIAHGGFSLTLKVEFSAPKLLFGNNFDELEESDFGNLLNKLLLKLDEMGVAVSLENLREAPISSIHFSKNFILEEYITSSMIIQELSKIDLNQHLDLANTDYRNQGHALRYHTNSYEITFYDKIKDLQQAKKSEKRAIENDNEIQLNLFQNKPKNLEVLRMEIRLGNRTKIKGLFKNLKIEAETTFQSLFKKRISQKILLHFWEKVSQGMDLLGFSQTKPEDLYRIIERNAKNLKPAKILQQIGTLHLINSIGVRGLRVLMGKYSSRTWQRLKKVLKNNTTPDTLKIQTIEKIEGSLIEFFPVKLELYQVFKN